MCIAIYSPKGTDIPCEDYLKASWEENPDGAGFAFNTNQNQVKIVKGFMKWESFWEAFQKYSREQNFKDRGVLIHFRVQTHGGVNPECTHPFPIVDDEGCLQKLEYLSPYAVIHNGIISLTSFDARNKTKMSDTMVFIQKYLTKIASYKNWFENPKTFELIYDLIESKMAILRGDGTISATYGFEKDEDGNYYSNQSYKHGRYKAALKPYASSWGWDDYDDGYGSYYNDNYSKASKAVQLQKLAPGQIAITETDEYFYDKEFPTYISDEGEIFCCDHPLKTSYWVSDELLFLGEGAFVDKNYNNVPFHGTLWTSCNNLIY